AFKPDGSEAQSIDTGGFNNDKVSYQLSPSNKLIGFYQYAYKHTISGATQFVSWDSRTDQILVSQATKGAWQHVHVSRMSTSLQYGYFGHGLGHVRYQNPAKGQVRMRDSTSTYVTGPNTNVGQRNFQAMNDLRFTASMYKADLLGGNHTFKLGASNMYT